MGITTLLRIIKSKLSLFLILTIIVTSFYFPKTLTVKSDTINRLWMYGKNTKPTHGFWYFNENAKSRIANLDSTTLSRLEEYGYKYPILQATVAFLDLNGNKKSGYVPNHNYFRSFRHKYLSVADFAFSNSEVSNGIKPDEVYKKYPYADTSKMRGIDKFNSEWLNNRNSNYLMLHNDEFFDLKNSNTKFYSKYYPLGPNVNDAKLEVKDGNPDTIVSVFARKPSREYEKTFNNGIFNHVIGKDYHEIEKDQNLKGDFIAQLFVATEGFTSWNIGAIFDLLNAKDKNRLSDFYDSNRDRVEVIYSNPDIFSKCMKDIQALQFGKWESGNVDYVDYDGTTVAKSMLVCIAFSLLSKDSGNSYYGLDKLRDWIAQSGNTDNASLLMTIAYGIAGYEKSSSPNGASEIIPVFTSKSDKVSSGLSSSLFEYVKDHPLYLTLIGSHNYKGDKYRISQLQDVFSEDLFGWGNILHRDYQSRSGTVEENKLNQTKENIAYQVKLPYSFLESKYLSTFSSSSWLPNLFWNVELKKGYNDFNISLDKNNKITVVKAGPGSTDVKSGNDLVVKHLLQIQETFANRSGSHAQNKYYRISKQRNIASEYANFLTYLSFLEMSGEDKVIFVIRFRTNVERGDYDVSLKPEDAKWLIAGKTYIPKIPNEVSKATWNDLIYEIPLSDFKSSTKIQTENDSILDGKKPAILESQTFNDTVWNKAKVFDTSFTRSLILPKKLQQGFQDTSDAKNVVPDDIQQYPSIEITYKLKRVHENKKRTIFNAVYEPHILCRNLKEPANAKLLRDTLYPLINSSIEDGAINSGSAAAKKVYVNERINRILDAMFSHFSAKEQFAKKDLNKNYIHAKLLNQFTASRALDASFMLDKDRKSKLSKTELKGISDFYKEVSKAPENMIYKSKFNSILNSTLSTKGQKDIGKLYIASSKIIAPFGFLRPELQNVDSHMLYAYSRGAYTTIKYNKKPDIPEEEYNNDGYWVKHPSRAEIKEGSIGNETFEAMAGVPTTKNLYFSVGATEFRVRIKGTIRSAKVDRVYTINASASWSGNETNIPRACAKDETGPCTTFKQHSGSFSGRVELTVPTSNFNYFDLTDVELWRLTNVGWEKDTDFTYSTTRREIGTGAYVFDIDGPEDKNGRIIFSSRGEDGYGSYSSNKSLGNKNFTGDAETGSPWSNKEQKHKEDCTKDLTQRLKSAVSALEDVGATVVSDSITIHTSKGNQTLQFYSQESDNKVNLSKYAKDIKDTKGGGNVSFSTTTPPIKFSAKQKDDYWKNNPNSCANWTNNDITFEGYNGQYATPGTKYTNTNASGKLTTKNLIGEEFTKLKFTPPTYKVLGVPNATADNHVINNIDIVDTFENGTVSTGRAYTKYERIWFRNNGTLMSNTADDSIFEHEGGFYEEDSVPYSDTNDKLNDIVIHDPVSTEYCTIVPNPSYFDQRIPEQKVDFDPSYSPFDGNNINYKQIKESASASTAFINLDREFKIFYPFRGDFAENPSLYGIDQVTNTRGKGFTSPMDLREYTKKRTIKFTFDVIPKNENRIHKAGELIDLNSIDKNAETFEFYCILSNDEAAGTPVDWTSFAINNDGDYLDNSNLNNATRYDFAARHSAWRQTYVDIIGTIGGLSLHDTEDWRFAELFKKVRPNAGWLIKNLVHRVNPAKQNMMVADELDVRREERTKTAHQLNTYGFEHVKDKQTKMFDLPLVPKYNPVEVLRNQTIRIGYNIFADVETIGSYYGNTSDITGKKLVDTNLGNYLNIQPIYYAYDLVHNVYKPVDIYYNNNGSIVPCYLFNDRSSESLSKYYYYQDLKKMKKRINVSNKELDRTKKVQSYLSGGTWDYRDQEKRYSAGHAASIVLYDKHRTFVGSSKTNGRDMNPGDVNNELDYQKHGQRWLFMAGLPSSAQFVEAGKPYTKEEAKKITNKQHIIVLAGNIITKGDVWTLRYTVKGDNSFQVVPNGKVYPKLPAPYGDIPVISVSRADKTSKDDIIEQGTH